MITLKGITDKKLKLSCLNSVSVGRAYDLLRDDIRAHLKKAHEDIGFEYCRFHALFHDDMDVVYEKSDGSIGYRWHHVDKIYDFLLSIGMRPFVELNPMPSLLASGDTTMFWYEMNITPPKSMDMWYDLVYNFVVHVTDRYGKEEVSKWFFEVWNEPNLDCFWTGGKEKYYELYTASANAVKAVDLSYRIGGPATAVADWIEDTIEYCTKNNVPLDFITTHLYSHDEYCRYGSREDSPYELGMYYIENVKQVYETVKKSALPDLPIYWTEFNTLSTDSAENITFIGNTALDRLYGASCVVRSMISTNDYSDGVSYWVVSDVFEEAKMSHLPFAGSYGLMTIHGIKKATYNAFTLMEKMKGNVIDIDVQEPFGCGVVAVCENDVYRILLWNNKLPEIKEQPVWVDKIFIDGINCDEYVIEQAKIKEGQGSAYEAWLEMGAPENLTPFEEEFLRSCSQMEYTIEKFDSDGAFSFSLESDEVTYFEIHKKENAVYQSKQAHELDEKLKTY